MRSRATYAFQICYAVVSALFVAGVLYQVYLTGLIVVAGTSAWDNHIVFGFLLGLVLLVMLPLVYLGRLPRHVKTITWALFGVYFLQLLLVRLRSLLPPISALHPVLALLDFVLGWRLAREAWGLVRAKWGMRSSQLVVSPGSESRG